MSTTGPEWNDDMVPVAELLSKEALLGGLHTWAGFALFCGITPDRLSKWLYGADSTDTAKAIREALNGKITLDELLARHDDGAVS